MNLHFRYDQTGHFGDFHPSGGIPMPLSEYEYITVKYVDTTAVVGFRETVAMFEGDKVEAVGRELIDLVESRKDPKILLNLSNAHFVSSAMLAHLVKLHRKIQNAKGRLKLCGLRPVIMDAFKVSRFDKIFEIHPDEASALKKF
jgi:anti-anti-sigma factor